MQEQNVSPAVVPRVMIIESDTDLAYILQELLQGQNISTMLVSTKYAALQSTKGSIPLLFLINQCMADGDGLDLYDQLHQRSYLSHVPVLILSTQKGRYQHQFERRGIIGLEIPVELEDLISNVLSLLPSQLL